MCCRPDFLQPHSWTWPLDPLSQGGGGAYLRLTVLWAKADSIIGQLLDGGDAGNRTVEALKENGGGGGNLSPRGDVVVSTLPCSAARGPTLTGAPDQYLSPPFQKIAKNATSYLSKQTVVCIRCIFRSNRGNFRDF